MIRSSSETVPLYHKTSFLLQKFLMQIVTKRVKDNVLPCFLLGFISLQYSRVSLSVYYFQMHFEKMNEPFRKWCKKWRSSSCGSFLPVWFILTTYYWYLQGYKSLKKQEEEFTKPLLQNAPCMLKPGNDDWLWLWIWYFPLCSRYSLVDLGC